MTGPRINGNGPVNEDDPDMDLGEEAAVAEAEDAEEGDEDLGGDTEFEDDFEDGFNFSVNDNPGC